MRPRGALNNCNTHHWEASQPTLQGIFCFPLPSWLKTRSQLYRLSLITCHCGCACTPGNVFYESYDISTVDIQTHGNTIRNNLALGTIKEMVGKSGQDLQMPATYMLAFGDNTVEGNVAAGSERLGYMLYGPACSSMALFRNNSAHSSVVGMWLQSSVESAAEGCTAVYNFTSFMSWDFGIITTKGIDTDVQLVDFNVMDMKHAGILMLRIGGMYDPAEINITRGVIAGATGPEVCALCNTRIVGLESVTSGPDGNSNVVYQGDAGE